jgi:hypothetical protein
MSRDPDDLTATKLRDRPIDESDTVVDEDPALEQLDDDSSMSEAYQYYESSPDRDDDETRRIVQSALKLLLGRSESKK